MHKEVNKFLRKLQFGEFWYFFKRKKVLECGSQYINGSPRKFFWCFCDYWGIDIQPGKGVDEAIPAHLHFKPDYYDVVISTEMLEHSQTWAEDLYQMYLNLRVGGLMIITCAGPDRAEHGTIRSSPRLSPGTTSYYRNISVDDFRKILPSHLFSVYRLGYENGSEDLQFYGIKNPQPWRPSVQEIYRALTMRGLDKP